MIRFTVTLDRGPDLGQNGGSLFEARCAHAGVVYGAGFQGVYNTSLRMDRHVVQFFVRPTDGRREFRVERLPRVGQAAGVYLVDLGGDLLSARDRPRRWNGAAWENVAGWGLARERVGAGHLRIDGSRVEYDGRTVLEAPTLGSYQRHYFAQGHLCFYHVHRGDGGYRAYENDALGFSKLVACPWDPAAGEQANMAAAITLTLPVVGETTFSWGQRGREVVTCSNIGGLYVFDGTQWRVLRQPELGRSYQIYTMLSFYERFLMGQYPAGEFFDLVGDAALRLPGWPPRMAGVSAAAREAQTAVIYGGELYVGVWPWGELWRCSPDTTSWSFVRRMFSHPPVTDATTHPYEAECVDAGIVANQWGQRVTSLVPMGEALIVGTSAKWPCEWKPAYTFLDDGKWKDYGAVYRLRTSGNLSVPLQWTDGPTTLVFEVVHGGLSVSQDDKVLGTAALDEGLVERLCTEFVADEISWGRGVFGPFQGRHLHGAVTVPLQEDPR